MDRRLRRAPDAEWVLMYRSGLSRARIAALVRAEPATIGYHLVIARRHDPGPGGRTPGRRRHRTGPRPLPRGSGPHGRDHRLDHGPRQVPENQGHRGRVNAPSHAWLSRRRREATDNTLHPAYSTGLARVPGWADNRRAAADEARWHQRLAQLVAFRAEGHDWPRHHDYASEREHTLGVWIHTQRSTHRAGDLDPVKLTLLDDAVPGWQTGRTRGRPPRQ